jgi:hypothetical protein
MKASKLDRLTDDQVFARWKTHFDVIHKELTYLMSTRRKFEDIREMFNSNARLRAIGSQPYGWILGIWGRDAVIAVRRELDDDRNTICFGSLLDEMAARPRVLTRARYMAFMKNSDQFLIDSNNRTFSKRGIIKPTSNPNDDYLDPAVIKADRKTLNIAAKPVLAYANRLVAHRTPTLDRLEVSINQINHAIDAIEPVFKKYHVILTGSSLVRLEPYNQGDDWRETFTFPWYVKPRLALPVPRIKKR